MTYALLTGSLIIVLVLYIYGILKVLFDETRLLFRDRPYLKAHYGWTLMWRFPLFFIALILLSLVWPTKIVDDILNEQ